MNDWTAIAGALGDLCNLAAAVVTLLALRSQRPDK